MADRPESQASLKPLAHSWSEYPCAAGLAEALQVEVKEVLGSSPVVARGESYLVRGEYVLNRPQVAWLRLSCQGTSRGRQAALVPGRSKFEITAEALDVAAARERVLDVTMADQQHNHLGVRVRIRLEG